MTSEYAWRYDKGPSGPVSRGSGRSAGGKGYNPYRGGDGKFAPGAHKERPKVGRAGGVAAGPAAKGRAPAKAKAPARAKFNAEPHRQLIAGHKAVEAHHRGESLRLAGEIKALKEQAKATKPRSAERASLKEQHAALKAQRDEHKTKATAARAERIAASKGMQAARKEHAAGQKPRSAPGPAPRPAEQRQSLTHEAPSAPVPSAQSRRIVADGLRGDPAAPSMTPEAQRTLRAHYHEQLAQFGIKPNAALAEREGVMDNPPGHTGHESILVMTKASLGGSAGMADHDGKILVEVSQARGMVDHFQASPKELGSRAMRGDAEAQRMIDAKHTAIHETIHGTGPDKLYRGRGLMAEEMTTELSARTVIAAEHGIPLHLYPGGAYDQYIRPAAAHLRDASGRSFEDAYVALAHASVEHKASRSHELVYGENVLHNVATSALKKLGVDDPAAHRAAYDQFIKISDSTKE